MSAPDPIAVLQKMERVVAIARSYRMEPQDAEALEAVLVDCRVTIGALGKRVEAAEMEACEAQSLLWRIHPNQHTVPSEINGFAEPDPFEGPGETWRAAYERLAATA